MRGHRTIDLISAAFQSNQEMGAWGVRREGGGREEGGRREGGKKLREESGSWVY